MGESILDFFLTGHVNRDKKYVIKTDMNIFKLSINLAGQNLVLKGLGYSYDGNTTSTLFFHETAFPLSYGAEDLTDKTSFAMSIDLAGQNRIIKDPE